MPAKDLLPELLFLPSGNVLRWRQCRKPSMRRWPSHRYVNQDSIQAALDCARRLHEALMGGSSLWVTAVEATHFMAVPPSLIPTRLDAEMAGVEGAWPWTRLRKVRATKECAKHIELYLLDLWEEVRWVHRGDGAWFLGLNESKLRRLVSWGEVTQSVREFRGLDYRALINGHKSHPNALWLDDLLKAKAILKLRGLFGKWYSHERLESMLALEPETIARIRAGGLLTEAVYGKRRKRGFRRDEV